MSEPDPDPVLLDVLQRFVVSHGLPSARPIDVGATELVELLPGVVEHRLVGLLHDAATPLGSAIPDAPPTHMWPCCVTQSAWKSTHAEPFVRCAPPASRQSCSRA